MAAAMATGSSGGEQLASSKNDERSVNPLPIPSSLVSCLAAWNN
jgi:hypothetical protein